MLNSLPTSLVEDVESLLLEKKDHLIRRLKNLTDEQKQKVIDFFRKKPNLENKIDWNRKDLTYEDFLEVMDPERNRTWSQKRKLVKSSGIRGLRKGKDYVALRAPEGIDAYIPLNYEASKLIACKDIGSGVGEWCTASDLDYWDDYGRENIVLIYLLYSNTKEAIEYSRKDNKIDDVFDMEDEIISIGEVHQNIVKDNLRVINNVEIQYDPSPKWVKKAKISSDANFEVIEDGRAPPRAIRWFSGDWFDGTWKAGDWFDGTFHKEGTWIARTGTFFGGVFKGTFERGIWKGGTWDYKQAIWKDGLIFSSKFDGYIHSIKNPIEFYNMEKKVKTLTDLKLVAAGMNLADFERSYDNELIFPPGDEFE